MVKNKGGNRHKKQARKNISGGGKREKIRLATEAGEMYGQVIKIFGGGTADVLCNDGQSRLLVIRKKFRGRNRRDNQITNGSLVLVGLRDWEVVSKERRQKADLLFVYPTSQIESLKKTGDVSYRLLGDGTEQARNLVCGFEITTNKSLDNKPPTGDLSGDHKVVGGESPADPDDDWDFDDI